MDLSAYEQRARSGPCFICAFLAGDPAYRHETVYEDDAHVAFLDRYPTLPGGVPYREQQHHALMAENGVLSPTAEEAAALAGRLRRRLTGG